MLVANSIHYIWTKMVLLIDDSGSKLILREESVFLFLNIEGCFSRFHLLFPFLGGWNLRHFFLSGEIIYNFELERDYKLL